jgi:MOSC domain-containing protein
MTIVGRLRELCRYPVKSMQGERLEHSAVGLLGVAGDRGWALRDEVAGEIRGAKKLPALMHCAARFEAEPSDSAIPHVAITLPDGEVVSSADPGVSERISAVVGRRVTLHPRRPPADRDHYRRGMLDNPDFDAELRSVFGRLPDEPLPDLSVFPPEIFEYTSPLGTYFDAFPLHLLTDASLAEMSRREPSARFDPRRFRANFLVETSSGADGLVETTWSGKKLRIGRAVIEIHMPTARCVMTTLPQPDLPKDPSVLRTIVRGAEQCLGVYASVAEPGEVRVGDPVELLG